MFILYDLIFLVFTLFYLPVYLFKRKFHRGFLERLGILPKGLTLGRPIWIHAVSVGEASAVKGLVEQLRQAWPQKKLVISTVTPTGNKVAKAIARDGDLVTYLPLDFSFIVKSALKRINPSLFIIAETELWPNLINSLHKIKVPIVVVNARISDASFGGYKLIKFLLKPILSKVSVFCAQSELDGQRLLILGVPREKVVITGNMKFDINPKEMSFDALNLGLTDKDILWVCGSTHPGEEEILLQVYVKLLNNFSSLKLLLAPRHPERSAEVKRIVLRKGFQPAFVSCLKPTTNGQRLTTVFILDTIGQLNNCYALADIVFVGGSLKKFGGHNILEPAVLGKPLIFGPHMFNFRGIAELFLQNKAGLMARNGRELYEKVRALLNNPKEMQGLAVRGVALIQQNKGATNRNVEIIKKAYAGVSL